VIWSRRIRSRRWEYAGHSLRALRVTARLSCSPRDRWKSPTIREVVVIACTGYGAIVQSEACGPTTGESVRIVVTELLRRQRFRPTAARSAPSSAVRAPVAARQPRQQPARANRPRIVILANGGPRICARERQSWGFDSNMIVSSNSFCDHGETETLVEAQSIGGNPLNSLDSSYPRRRKMCRARSDWPHRNDDESHYQEIDFSDPSYRQNRRDREMKYELKTRHPVRSLN